VRESLGALELVFVSIVERYVQCSSRRACSCRRACNPHGERHHSCNHFTSRVALQVLFELLSYRIEMIVWAGIRFRTQPQNQWDLGAYDVPAMLISPRNNQVWWWLMFLYNRIIVACMQVTKLRFKVPEALTTASDSVSGWGRWQLHCCYPD
jgi:hypothetical protein